MLITNELRIVRDNAEQAHRDCLRRIRSYERLISESDPRAEDEYNDLLDRLHALEQKERQLWFEYQRCHIRLCSAEFEEHREGLR